MQLFYSDHIQPDFSTHTFTREESKHIVRVLRKKQGDIVHLTNGKGYLFKATLLNENPNKCAVSITTAHYHKPLPYYLHIAVAPTKLNDRFEWFLEKATEIGVSEITPILCNNSERKTIKWERYNKILQSALKQSLQYHLPKLNALTTYDDFITTEKNIVSTKFIAHCDEGEKTTVKSFSKTHHNITILIGPEGDFSLSEIQHALNHNFQALSLGANRLRTETAAVLACAQFAFLQL